MPSFASAVPVPVGSGTTSVFSGYLNGDSKADLVTTNNFDGTVSVLLGNGDGTFSQPAAPYPCGGSATFVTAFDVTGDDNLDLLVANYGPFWSASGNTIGVLVGHGDGTFDPVKVTPVGTGPDSIAAGDFDRDGKTDLAVANWTDNTISLLWGNGDGTFRAGPTLTTDTNPIGLTAAKFGPADPLSLVVACTGCNDVEVFHDQADGSFTGPDRYNVGAGPNGLTVHDLNGDGNLDLAVANAYDQTISILPGNGDGTFDTTKPLSTVSTGPLDFGITTADVNGDGIPDLVAAQGIADGYWPDYTAGVYVGKGDGTFEGPIYFRVGSEPRGIAVGDFNGDGRPDIVAPNLWSSQVSVLFNDGAWFATPSTIPTEGGVTWMATADFTGDGRTDLAVAEDGTLNVLLRNADGSYTTSATFTDCFGSVAVGDVNNDGIPDLVYSGNVHITYDGDQGVLVRLGNGDGTFGKVFRYEIGYPHGVTVGDFNNDGNLDIAVATYQSAVGLLWGNGDGSFQPAQLIPTGNGSVAVAAGDLARNGREDLVAANYEDGSLDVLLSHPDGSFTVTNYSLYGGPGPGTSQVVIADFDGDGKLDLATADRNWNGISVLFGNGDGTFGRLAHYTVWPQRGPVALVAVDLNGDRMPDLAIASSLTGTVSFLLNQGDGTFGNVMNYPAGGPVFLATADLNGDGVADVLVGDGNSGIHVLLNSKDFTPAPGTTPSLTVSSPTMTYGTPTTTFSGTIGSPGQIPSGDVLVTFGQLTKRAPIDPATGAFSATFDTSTLLFSASPYRIQFSFAGDDTYTAAGTSSHLTVTPDPRGGNVFWITPAGGDWNDPNNWNIGAVPGATDDVFLNTPAPIAFSAGTTDTIHNLTLTGPNRLALNGALTVLGAFDWNGDTLSGSGSLTVKGTTTPGPDEVVSGLTLVLKGPTTWNGGAIHTGNGGQIVNDDTFTVQGDGTIADSTDGLVGSWAAEGNANDLRGVNNGILEGTATYGPGQVGTAFTNLDSQSKYVYIPWSPSLALAGVSTTIESWVNVTAVNPVWSPVSPIEIGALGLWYNAEGHFLRAHMWTSTSDPGPYEYLDLPYTLPTGTWVHLAQVYDAATSVLSVYVNDTLLGSGVTGTSYWPFAGEPLLLGKGWGPGDSIPNYLASFDEAAVYGRALSGVELRAAYVAGAAGTVVAPGLFLDAGTVIKKGGTGTLCFATAFDNQGGTVDAESGTIVLSGGGTSTGGTFDAAGGSSIDLTGGSDPTLTGTWTGSGGGTLSLAGGSITIGTAGAAFNFDAGLFQWTGGNLDLQGNLTIANGLSWTGGTLTGSGTATISGKTTLGTAEVVNGATLVLAGKTNLDSGALAVTSGGRIENHGTFTFSGDAGIPDLASGVLHTWSADGTTADLAGGEDAVLQGSATFGPGETGQAFANLDGQSSYVEDPSSASWNLNGFSSTVESWVNVTAQNTIWINLSPAKPGSFGLWYYAPGQLLRAYAWMDIANPGVGEFFDVPYTLPSRTWVHFAQVFDAPTSTLSIYVNGALLGSGVSGTFYWNPGPSPVVIDHGWGPGDFGNANSASYDGIAIYDRALSAAEIQASYVAGAALPNPMLPGSFVNTGTVSKTGGTGTSRIGVAFDNQGGTVDAESGTISLAGGGTSTGGSYLATAPGTIDLTGGSDATFTGTYTGSGSGTVELTSGSITLGAGGATFDFSGTLFQWQGGTIHLAGHVLDNAGTITLANPAGTPVVLDGGAGGKLTNDGTLVQQTAGTLSFFDGAELDNAPDGTVTLQSDGTFTDRGGPVGWWSGEDTANDAGGGNNGILEGAAAYGPGQVGTAFTNLDSQGSYVYVPWSPALALAGGSSTVDSWVNVTADYPEWAPLTPVELGAFGLFYNVPGHFLQAHAWVNGWEPGAVEYFDVPYTLPLGTWLHFAQVYDAPTGALSIYVNGTLLGSGVTGGFVWNVSGQPVLLGKGWTPGDYSFHDLASFDEAAVYSRALSAAEIRALYDAGAAGKDVTAGLFVNEGTLTKQGGTGTSRLGVAFSNQGGTVDAESGTLSLAGGGTSTGGTFTATTGSVVDLTGGADPTFTGTWTGSGSGTVELSGGSLTIGAAGAAFNFDAGLFNWSGGNLDLVGNVTVKNGLSWTGGALTGSGTATVAGTTTLGTAEVVDGATLVLAGTTSLDGGVVTVSSGGRIKNQGTLTFSGDASVLDRSTGLVHAWSADGTTTDLAGAEDAVLHGNSIFGPGETGQAFANLDGQNSYVEDPPSASWNLNGVSSTVEDWVNVTAQYSIWIPLSPVKPGSFGLWYYAPGHLLRAYAWTDSANPGVAEFLDVPYTLPYGSWAHFAQVYDAPTSTLSVYANGTLLGSGVTGTFYWDPGLSPLVLDHGWTPGDFGNFNKASYDGIAVYDQALSAAEIQASYTAGAALPNPMLPGSFVNTGTVIESGGTTSIRIPFDNQGGTVDAEDGTIILAAGGTSTGGTYNANNTGVVDLTGGSNPTFTGTYTGSGNGMVELAGGAIRIGTAGAAFNFASGLLRLSGGAFNLDGNTVTNNGQITFTGGTVCVYGDGSFVNSTGATFTDTGDGTFGSCDGNCVPFVNNGLFDKTGGDGVTDLQMDLVNSGTVLIERGTLNLGCGYTQGSGGNGTISGNVTGEIDNPGQLNLVPSPTAPPPVVTAYTQTVTGTLVEEIGGLAAGTQYGQITVTGNVSLAGTLQVLLINGFVPQPGDQFTILVDEGSNPINGTFAGLPEGAVFTASGQAFQITYQGGDGNDVVLTYLHPAVPTFHNLVSPTIRYGTPTVVLSGELDAGGFIPGGSVAITINGVTQSASIDPATGQFTTTFAASGLHVNGSPYTVSYQYAGTPAYTPAQATSSLTLTPVPLTITADNKHKVYGASLPALTVSYHGFVNGDTSANLTIPPVISTTATAASHVQAGGYAITASGAVDADYTIRYVVGTLTVTPARLRIKADRQTKIYGAPLPVLTVTYHGLVNGDTPDTFNLAPNTPPSVTTTATAASHVSGSPYVITVSDAVDPDYVIRFVPGKLRVTPAPLTISADDKSMVYGGNLPALTATFTGLVNGDTPDAVQGMVLSTVPASSHVGSYAITVSEGTDADYAIRRLRGTLSITPAPLTVTADNATRVYGAANPTFTASYSGFVNGDTAGVLVGDPSLKAGARVSSDVGTYAIVAAQGSLRDADYTFSFVNGTLTITQDGTSVQVSSSANPSDYGRAVTFTAAVTANAPGSGTPTGTASFYDGGTLLGTGTLSGGVAKLTVAKLAAGNHTITVRYGGDSNFLGSASAALSQSVLSAQQQIALLVSLVNSLVGSGVLNSGNGNALNQKLTNATTSLNAGNVTAGVNQLKAFINQVNAFVNAGKLTGTQAKPLLDGANQAIASADA